MKQLTSIPTSVRNELNIVKERICTPDENLPFPQGPRFGIKVLAQISRVDPESGAEILITITGHKALSVRTYYMITGVEDIDISLKDKKLWTIKVPYCDEDRQLGSRY